MNSKIGIGVATVCGATSEMVCRKVKGKLWNSFPPAMLGPLVLTLREGISLPNIVFRMALFFANFAFIFSLFVAGALAAPLPDSDPPATNCDTLAAFTYDPQRKATGVDYSRIDAPRAIAECEAAVLSYPNSGRLQFQLGRALEKANEIERTLAAYQRAAKLGHPGGSNNLGEIYRDGKWFPQNKDVAFAYFSAAANAGYPEAEFNLAALLLQNTPNRQMVEKASQLLNLAAQTGYPNAVKSLRSLPAPSADTETSRHILDLIGISPLTASAPMCDALDQIIADAATGFINVPRHPVPGIPEGSPDPIIPGGSSATVGSGLGTNQRLREFTVNFAEIKDSPKAPELMRTKYQEARRHVTGCLKGVTFVGEDDLLGQSSTYKTLDGTKIEISYSLPGIGYPVWIGEYKFTSPQVQGIGKSSDQTCHYASLTPGTGEVQAGDVTLSIAEPDDPVKPDAWEGPITITKNGGPPCKTSLEVSLIQLPMYLDGQHLIVSTYSGSSGRVQVVDVVTCHVVWSSPVEGVNPLSGGHLLLDEAGILHMGNKQRRLGANCLP